MTIEDAMAAACAQVGIQPPGKWGYGRWLTTNTLAGRSGKGDGRVILNDTHATAWNWQTGESATVPVRGDVPFKERQRVAREIEQTKRRKIERAARAARLAEALLQRTTLEKHPYLVAKGFPGEVVLTVSADVVKAVAGAYLVPDGAMFAVLVPARRGASITSAQLIWEDGTKKFLADGTMRGASHRLSMGTDLWLCEGLATGLSLRAALKGFGASASVVCCFSAMNIVSVARGDSRRVFVAADHDRPLPQFGDVGTGEHYARAAGRPWTKPPELGTDFNDMHRQHGIFAVQAHLAAFIREATMPP